MTMTTREAFEKGTQTFNAHDIDGFAEVLADDVVFEAPGRDARRGERKPAPSSIGSWFTAFPDAHVEIHGLHIIDDVAVEEGTFTGTHDGVLRSPDGRRPADRPLRQRGLHPGAALPRRQTLLVQPDVRPAPDARAAWPHPRAGIRRVNHQAGKCHRPEEPVIGGRCVGRRPSRRESLARRPEQASVAEERWETRYEAAGATDRRGRCRCPCPPYCCRRPGST